MGRVDHEVQDDLVHLARVTHHRRQVAKAGLDVGHVLVLVAGDGQRRADRVVQILGLLLAGVRMGEPFMERTMVPTRSSPSRQRAPAGGTLSSRYGMSAAS